VEHIDQGRLLASIAATSDDCILSTDVAGTVLWASAASEQVLGWRPEELAGHSVAMVATRLGGDVHRDHLQRVLEGERVPSFVDEVVRRDGSAAKASITLGPVQDAAGAVVGITMILRDVTAETRDRRLAGPVGPAAGRHQAHARRTWSSSIVLDPDLRLTYVAASVAPLLGGAGTGKTADLGPDAWRAAIHPDDAPETGRMLMRVATEPWRTERLVVRLRDGAGRWRPVDHVVSNRFDDPDVQGLLVRLRDATAEVHREDALRLSEALQRALVERALEGVLTLAPDGATSFANERMADLLGIPLPEVYAGGVLARLGLDRWRTEAGQVEVDYTDPAGRARVLAVKRCPLTGPASEVLGTLLTVADVTEARRVESTLRRQALHDPLTGLPNRYLFLDRLDTAAARHARTPIRGTAVLFLDLDGFKPVNDTHGHAAGDGLLQQVAARLSSVVRSTDTIARLGGDEFAIICEDIDESGAMRVAGKILAELRRPVEHAGTAHQVGVSIGVAVSPPHPFDDLVALADRAMYQAKQLGGSRVSLAGREDAGAAVQSPEGVR
jgi:diguanylate cyclase (GGDEF)-like protein/PAS domain S-box-containing protein